MTLVPLLRTALALAVVTTVSGCAATRPAPPAVNLSGYSTEFRQGYADGCDSAGGSRTRKDEARYRDDADYMMGWNDGYSVCGRRRK